MLSVGGCDGLDSPGTSGYRPSVLDRDVEASDPAGWRLGRGTGQFLLMEAAGVSGGVRQALALVFGMD